MTRKNKIILTCSILSLFLLFLFSSILVSLSFNKKENVKAATTYSIGDLSSLQTFISKVNGGESDANAKLTADVNCGGDKLDVIGRMISPFHGTFDGKGFKIYNFYTDDTPVVEYADIHAAQGFFGYTNRATITNLRLTNFTHTATPNGSGRTAVGGLVGYPVDTTITCCQVDNFTIKSYDISQVYIGGIAGYGQEACKISNCYVGNFQHSGRVGVFSGSSSLTYRVAGIAAYASSIDQSIFNPGTSQWTVDYFTVMSGEYQTKTLYQGGASYKIDDYVSAGQISCDNSVSNCYSSSGMHYFGGIAYKSAEGGKTLIDDFDNNIPWYYNTLYNTFPVLRQFIDWKTYIITTSNTTVSHIEGDQEWEIPTTGISFNLTQEQLNAYTISFVCYTSSVRVTNDAYEFEKWTISGNEIKANIVEKTGKITFVNIENAQLGVATLSYEVPNNTTISVNLYHNYVLFNFKNINGTNCSVQYTITSNKYYFKESGLTKNVVYVGEEVVIAPIVELKTYNVEFQ